MRKPVTQMLMLLLTVLCGAGAIGLCVLTAYVPGATNNPMVTNLFGTFSGLFLSGMTTLMILWGK